MEKRGIVSPGITPLVEEDVDRLIKKATDGGDEETVKEAIFKLQDEPLTRLSEIVAKS